MLVNVDIRHAWPRIKDGVRDVIEKTGYEWTPEEIYSECRSRKAFLFMPASGENSFVVLTTYDCPYRAHKVLLILVAWSEEGHAVEKYLDEIEKIGREAGCVDVEFVSSRRGWERAGAAHGFKAALTTFRKAL